MPALLPLRGCGPPRSYHHLGIQSEIENPPADSGFAESALALQLQRPAFEVSLLCDGLVGAPPSRPSNDEGWLNAPLRQSDRYAPDLLDRPRNLQAWR